MFFLDPNFVETGQALSLCTCECNSYILTFAGCSKQKRFLLHPAQTPDTAWLCMWEGEQNPECQGAVTACKVGLVLVSTAGIFLLCSHCGLGCQPKFLELEGKKAFCMMHYKH